MNHAARRENVGNLGIGIGWRPEIAEAVEALPGIDWVEAVAENICADHLPDSLVRLRKRGVTVVPHGVSLGLGGAERPDAKRLADLAERAEILGSPLITEHIAFVRAGGPLTASPTLEAGHLLPVPRTEDALRVLVENVRIAQDSLPVPLAVENIAALINWPDEEMTEGQFLAELVERTGVRLLIDVANLHTNHVNRGEDPATALDQLPVAAIAYVHVAGGVERDGVWHDTHAHPVGAPVLEVLAELRSRVAPPGVLLERDDNFPPTAELAAELDTIRATLRGPGPRATGLRSRDVDSEASTGAEDPTETAETAETAGPEETAGPDEAGRDEAGRDEAGRDGTDGPGDAVPGPHTVPEAPSPVAHTVNVGRPGAGAAPAQAEGLPTDPARERLALAQTSLLSALVAGTPAPEGFDSRRLRVQSRALTGKRAEVVAKVAPELPRILGDGYRAAFLTYAKSRPMRGGYRRDALDFAEHLLVADLPEDAAARRELTWWWQDRAGARPPSRAVRIARVARSVLVGR